MSLNFGSVTIFSDRTITALIVVPIAIIVVHYLHYLHYSLLGSAGKSFSMTGYKLGWTLGPEELIRKVQAIHQTAIYSAPTITQVGLIFLDDYAND